MSTLSQGVRTKTGEFRKIEKFDFQAWWEVTVVKRALTINVLCAIGVFTNDSANGVERRHRIGVESKGGQNGQRQDEKRPFSSHSGLLRLVNQSMSIVLTEGSVEIEAEAVRSR